MKTSRSLPLLVLASTGLCLPSARPYKQEQSPLVAPRAAIALASRYLEKVDTSYSLSAGSREQNFVIVGYGPQYRGVRVLVAVDSMRPRLLWDSYSMRGDDFFGVMAPSSIDAFAIEGAHGYIVTIQGCAPHECLDGRLGFAVYASDTRRLYVAHVTARQDSSYAVRFVPRSGIPLVYLAQLKEMICTDDGISHPNRLPFECAHREPS